jgi:hypothetical protein
MFILIKFKVSGPSRLISSKDLPANSPLGAMLFEQIS